MDRSTAHSVEIKFQFVICTSHCAMYLKSKKRCDNRCFFSVYMDCKQLFHLPDFPWHRCHKTILLSLPVMRKWLVLLFHCWLNKLVVFTKAKPYNAVEAAEMYLVFKQIFLYMADEVKRFPADPKTYSKCSGLTSAHWIQTFVCMIYACFFRI